MNQNITLSIEGDGVRITKAKLQYRQHEWGTPIAEANASSRIYPLLKNFNVVDDVVLGDRRRKPYNKIRSVLPEVCKALGVDCSDMLFVWRQNCGCRCGCSPGFKAMGSATPKFDLWIEYELIAEHEASTAVR